MFKIIGGLLHFILMEHITISHTPKFTICPHQIIHTVHALDIHGKALKPIGNFTCHREALNATNLLKIGKLGNFHAI